MDIIESCEAVIKGHLDELIKIVTERNASQVDEDVFLQTQTAAEVTIADKDRNLSRILDQQAHVKMIIEKDGRIKFFNKAIVEYKRIIDMLRKSCSKIGMDSLTSRQELLESQGREREKYQMQQLKSIAEDYRRHQDILEQRKKEVSNLRKETENEESNRESYLADVEKNLDKQLQNRQQLQLSSSRPIDRGGVTDEVHNPNHIELTSIDEYAPYGNAPHSRVGTYNSGRGHGRGKQEEIVGGTASGGKEFYFIPFSSPVFSGSLLNHELRVANKVFASNCSADKI